MTDAATWVAAAVAIISLAIAWLTYRSQRNRKRLEYLVLTNTKLLPGRVANHVEVRHGERALETPTLAVVRLVNTGDRAITPEDFSSNLTITLTGVQEIASATWSATRPSDLTAELRCAGDRVEIEPTLLNPTDMLELQMLCAGQASDINVGGRIVELELKPRPALPYPPGSGTEGEMVSMDRFVWYWFTPGLGIAIGAYIAFAHDIPTASRLLVVLATAIIVGIVYPLHVRYLVRRRRMWRP